MKRVPAMRVADKRGLVSRLRITYILLLVCAVIIATYFSGAVPYVLLYLLLALALLAPLNIYLLRKKLSVQVQHTHPRYESGAQTELMLIVYNNSYLPEPVFTFSLHSNMQGWEQLTHCAFTAPPMSTVKQSIQLMFQYRGLYTFTIKDGLYSDMWDILRVRLPINQTTEIVVYPHLHRLESIQRSRILSEQEERFLKRGFEETGLYSEVRDYQPGDSQSRIHWKLTANKNALVSKLYETSDDDELLLWLDLHRPNGENTLQLQEKAIELVTAVVYFCLSRRLPFSLAYYHNGAPVIQDGRTMDDFDRLYTALATVPFDEKVTPFDFIRQQLPVRETLVFSAQAGQDFTALLDNPNRRVEVFALSDNETAWQQTAQRSLNVHTLSLTDDVRTVLEARR